MSDMSQSDYDSVFAELTAETWDVREEVHAQQQIIDEISAELMSERSQPLSWVYAANGIIRSQCYRYQVTHNPLTGRWHLYARPSTSYNFMLMAGDGWFSSVEAREAAQRIEWDEH